MSLLGAAFVKEFKSEFQKVCRSTDTSRTVNAANFVSLLYTTKSVDPVAWPAPRVLDEMYTRGYHNFVTQKASYGVQGPPTLTLDESLRWASLFRILEAKRLELN
jgi:hypothetical protein